MAPLDLLQDLVFDPDRSHLSNPKQCMPFSQHRSSFSRHNHSLSPSPELMNKQSQTVFPRFYLHFKIITVRRSD
jgi:hypothetical protein